MALRTRLLLAMLLPLLIAAILLGSAGAVLMTDVARRANDRVLGGALGAIAETVQVEGGEVTLDLPPAAFGMLENTERDNVYYRIAVGGALLTGYPDLPAPVAGDLRLDQPRYRYARYRGQDIRIAEVRRSLPRIAQPVVVQLAETLDNRAAVRRRLLIALVAGQIVLVAIAALLLRPALRWSLRPLSRLRDSVIARDRPALPDLSPLRSGPLPAELQPLAAAFDRLLARLDAATGGMRRFTADASHQMRTPLSVLKVQVTLARRGAPNALAEIEAATERLERLVTQLLALARADEAGLATPTERVDLREVAEAVIGRHIGRAIAARLELTLDARDGPFAIPAHRTLVFELLANLVDNAIRYNAPGGLVAVELTRDAGRVVLAVADDGPGISPADRERALDRFVRLNKPGQPDGTGLGLAIVASIAKRVGATLTLSDARPGLRAQVAFPAD